MKRSIKKIRLRGARQNNLKGINLEFPLGKLIVITGLSGAGKSSLLFEVLHAEGQRRYVETFSPYVRQFLETLPRPKVDEIQNVRPSIAVEQRNAVRTSRSTVGTMTELCDYLKVWFPSVAQLMDPASGKSLREESPATLARVILKEFAGQAIVVGFRTHRPDGFPAGDFLRALTQAGHVRATEGKGFCRIEELRELGWASEELFIGLDRVFAKPSNRARIVEAVTTALETGKGELILLSERGKVLGSRFEGLRSPVNGERFSPPSPSLFSFNSPVGACPCCRGFGRVIEVDYHRVIPDESLSIADGTVRAFRGKVYGHSQSDLLRAARRHGFPEEKPWRFLSDDEKAFVLDGEEGYVENAGMWYGLRRFFRWLETKTYKMHVRVFLSKYRGYFTCPDCNGARLQPNALLWRWRGKTFPDLCAMPVTDLATYLERWAKPVGDHRADLALDGIRVRLGYLEQVGLGYLSLDRASRTLSGGETQRVNLTACLGASLTETLFALDEPSIGLHARDVDRLIRILRHLADQGNTVCVVEHDERIIRAADHVIELGPAPGTEGGRVTFVGSVAKLEKDKCSLTGAYLSGRRKMELNQVSRTPLPAPPPFLRIRGASRNNLRKLNLDLPLGCFVALAGVSGSGKSTLLENVVHDGFLASLGQVAEDAADLKSIRSDVDFVEVVMVDQTPLGKTPRSNPALFTDAWGSIRDAFARTDDARRVGFSSSDFSFNSGTGRCEQCQGLGYERVEMQFLADVYAPCPACEGCRFKDEILAIRLDGLNITQVLELSVSEAVERFDRIPRTSNNLRVLEEVGLGYLPLGQPLNTLSGGEAQRLKLVKYLGSLGSGDKPSLLLLDEPTTGLHRHDVAVLLRLLRRLVDNGHSLIVIEHQPDVLASSDWLVELGPGAGNRGGKVVAQGIPAEVSKGKTPTAPMLAEAVGLCYPASEPPAMLLAAEEQPSNGKKGSCADSISIIGARENNLKNLSLAIPRNAITVVTGPSGSGKSSLAFDVVFAEGQRRFLESMSSYARQFVEQLPRPEVDELWGIAPTVAIEQRVTRGSRKSTVGTITEVAHYLRLLYARVGTQLSPTTGEPVETASFAALAKHLQKLVKQTNSNGNELLLCAPLARGRKGHHRPLAAWATSKGYELLRCDGKLMPTEGFEGLERYVEHDVEVVVTNLGGSSFRTLRDALEKALALGKGSSFLLNEEKGDLTWFATTRVDPVTGEAFPELEPKHFSWHSPRGWCLTCRGYGHIHEWMKDDLPADGDWWRLRDGEICPSCDGDRLSSLGRAAVLHLEDGNRLTFPEMLRLTPSQIVEVMEKLVLDTKGKAVAELVTPEIRERLVFMETVGLGYLTLDRETATLSGGEAQRIRLSAQLGSNLSGALYVLDEPSIGLHAKDNRRLLDSLDRLKDKGNTLLVVEHDEETMRRADHIIDLGPEAGKGGGHLLANGRPRTVLKSRKSLTAKYLRDGIPHPLFGKRRPLPKKKPRRRSRKIPPDWFGILGARFRNLKEVDLWMPVNRLIGVCGVSGAGKSSLARGLLKPAVVHAAKTRETVLSGRELLDKGIVPVGFDQKAPFLKILNGNQFAKVIEVDQHPIGKTPRSTPATYIGVWDRIRMLMSTLPEARVRGLAPGAFSFNVKGGRCEPCKGAGKVKLEMNFLPDAYVTCEVCNGFRYGEEMLSLRWREKNVAEILDLSFSESADFFFFDRKLKAVMDLMVETGLGYLKLGQSSPTLSGGEAQRVKLVSELSKGVVTGKTVARNTASRQRGNLYLLEEPTIGLHSADCVKLLHLLHRLVDDGHTVVVIEHHLDILADADYLVELGPGGGNEGGQILFSGKPEDILKTKASPTAPYLEKVLRN